MSLAIERSMFNERHEVISLYDLARNNQLDTTELPDWVLPDIEVMSDGGVFIRSMQTSYNKINGLYYKSVYLVFDERYHLVPDHEDTFVKITPTSNILKISSCISMNGEYDIEYLINANNATVSIMYELRSENGVPTRIAHSSMISDEYRNIQSITNMIYSQFDTNGNGLSNEFIKNYIRIHDK